MFNEKFFSTNSRDLFAYLNLFSLLSARINIASNKDFTDTIDTIMYEFYIKNNKSLDTKEQSKISLLFHRLGRMSSS